MSVVLAAIAWWALQRQRRHRLEHRPVPCRCRSRSPCSRLGSIGIAIGRWVPSLLGGPVVIAVHRLHRDHLGSAVDPGHELGDRQTPARDLPVRSDNDVGRSRLRARSTHHDQVRDRGRGARARRGHGDPAVPAGGLLMEAFGVRRAQSRLLIRPSARTIRWMSFTVIAATGGLVVWTAAREQGDPAPVALPIASALLCVWLCFLFEDLAAETTASSATPLLFRRALRAAIAVPAVAAVWFAYTWIGPSAGPTSHDDQGVRREHRALARRGSGGRPPRGLGQRWFRGGRGRGLHPPRVAGGDRTPTLGRSGAPTPGRAVWRIGRRSRSVRAPSSRWRTWIRFQRRR